MSRSYKRYPKVRQERIDRKKMNRRIRYDRFATFNTPGLYRKYCTDWGWDYHWSKEDAINEYKSRRDGFKSPALRFTTLEDYLLFWWKSTIRK